jgi:PAS domain S-box-containing protein
MTGRKRAEEKPQKSEEGFSAIFELASVGAVIHDTTGRALRVNAKMCEITGYSEEELLGKTPSDITHPDDVERDLESFRRMAGGETPVYGREKRYLRKDGQIRWVSVNATPIRDEAGRLLRLALARSQGRRPVARTAGVAWREPLAHRGDCRGRIELLC